jgi:hypothetical protein
VPGSELIVGNPTPLAVDAHHLALIIRLRSDRGVQVRDGHLIVDMTGDTDEFKDRMRDILRLNGFRPLT